MLCTCIMYNTVVGNSLWHIDYGSDKLVHKLLTIWKFENSSGLPRTDGSHKTYNCHAKNYSTNQFKTLLQCHVFLNNEIYMKFNYIYNSEFMMMMMMMIQTSNFITFTSIDFHLTQSQRSISAWFVYYQILPYNW